MRALPADRGEVQNWIDFSKAVIGDAGLIKHFVRRKKYEPTVHFCLQLS